MGKLLDQLRQEMDQHPEWDASHQDTVTKMAEKDFLDTFSGRIYEYLKRKGEQAGVAVRVEQKTFGRAVFFYGDETALLQFHTEGGVAQPYTNALDLQKPWWKEAFLEYGEQGKMENIGVIAPSLMEILGKNCPDQTIQECRAGIRKLLVATGKNPADLTDEYTENDVYGAAESDVAGVHVGDPGRKVMTELENSLRPLALPHFDVKFGNGNGDLYRKLRLVPLTREASESLLQNGELVQNIAQKISRSLQDIFEKNQL